MKDKLGTTIIAEAGVNHNGSIEIAKRLVDAAVDAGADIVKFQVFTANEVMVADSPKAAYQKELTDSNESQLDMVKALEFDRTAHEEIYRYCQEKNIGYLASPFDLGSVGFLADLGVDSVKIPSGEITNLPYLEKIGGLGKKIILSTGMATLKEIKFAFNTLVDAGTPHANISILHCTTEYPAPFEEVNLKVIHTLADAFPGTQVGYSDHTLGIEIPIAAVSMGATIIEKHFTLDKTMKGPDHKASLEPGEFKGMVCAIRHIEMAMGNGEKKPTASEAGNLVIVRKSIVAAKNIKKGEKFSQDNITVKRPGDGMSPLQWYEVLGKNALKDFMRDEKIFI